ncbi:N-6 DNA methylase [Streptomyces coeruleoprunus]|uniref:N-6 DNA methylase n=1 Tax=Streptomyces coeruleoprunus TaxID=285563 RepID=A0ABV9XAI7_9ACTN
MTDNAPPVPGPLVTGAEIARLAGVTRAAVSNWRRRHGDFPAPVGGGAGTPLFALDEVRAWLGARRKDEDLPAGERLWQALRAAYGDRVLEGLRDVARHLAAAHGPDDGGPAGPPGGDDAGAGRGADPRAAVFALASGPARHGSAAAVVDDLVVRHLAAARRAGADQGAPARLVRAVVRFAAPLPAAGTILDPACGTGGLLLALGAGAEGARCVGQDADPVAAELAALRARLAGLPGAAVACGDSLRDDRWPGLPADLVVCDPPAATPDWGREELLLDARWELGVPSRAEGELAWLQHCYAHTAPGGRAVLVMPPSVAYRKAGRRIRAALVRRGLLTEVIALPAGTAATHSLPVHLWILRRPTGPGDGAPAVRMTDLTGADPDGPLDPRPGQTAEVPPVDLLDDTVDLTPGHHVRASHRTDPAEYRAVRARLEDALHGLTALLPALVPGPGGTPDATLDLAGLARAGLVDLRGPDGPASTGDLLDTDFLRGFLACADRTSGSTRTARVPRMDLPEQRRYGAAFRAVREFEDRIRDVAELGARAARLAREGLADGTLTPPPEHPVT